MEKILSILNALGISQKGKALTRLSSVIWSPAQIISVPMGRHITRSTRSTWSSTRI